MSDPLRGSIGVPPLSSFPTLELRRAIRGLRNAVSHARDDARVFGRVADDQSEDPIRREKLAGYARTARERVDCFTLRIAEIEAEIARRGSKGGTDV